MHGIIQSATSVSTPLALGGLFAAILFLILRQLIAKNVFPKLGGRSGARLLGKVINYLFVLALLAMLLGFAGYIYSNSGNATQKGSSSKYIARSAMACRWSWVYLGRYSASKRRYVLPEAFRFDSEDRLRTPIPDAGDTIIITIERSLIVKDFAKLDASKRCSKMLDPPVDYRPETALDYEAGKVQPNTKVLVNQIALLPTPTEDPTYVWALVGPPS